MNLRPEAVVRYLASLLKFVRVGALLTRLLTPPVISSSISGRCIRTGAAASTTEVVASHTGAFRE